MHELGHVILNHNQFKNNKLEQEANFFASNILAPRMAIHYAKCINSNSVSKLFGMTNEAAQYAFNDYIRWYRRVACFKMSSFDKALYSHFYNSKLKGFVYSIKKCAYCDTDIYNSNYFICENCKGSDQIYRHFYPLDEDFLIAESQWLYGWL